MYNNSGHVDMYKFDTACQRAFDNWSQFHIHDTKQSDIILLLGPQVPRFIPETHVKLFLASKASII